MTFTPAPVQSGQITGAVLLYNNPEPLSLELHGKLGLVRSDHPFAFAAAAQAVPMQVTEFGPASLTYPIIFGGEQITPLAIMGLRPGENLFVQENGAFESVAYVPAFIRRYPFVLANNEVQKQMIVCIDRQATSLVEGGDVPLFENGQPSAFTQSAIQFCTEFETERLRTVQFTEMLQGLDLLETRQAAFTPKLPDGSDGEPIQLAEFFAVSEEKLIQLPPDKLAELNASGALRQIHLHLNSLLNWERLIAKSSQRASTAAAPAPGGRNAAGARPGRPRGRA